MAPRLAWKGNVNSRSGGDNDAEETGVVAGRTAASWIRGAWRGETR